MFLRVQNKKKTKNDSCRCLSRVNRNVPVARYNSQVSDHPGIQNGYLDLKHTWPANSSKSAASLN